MQDRILKLTSALVSTKVFGSQHGFETLVNFDLAILLFQSSEARIIVNMLEAVVVRHWFLIFLLCLVFALVDHFVFAKEKK